MVAPRESFEHEYVQRRAALSVDITPSTICVMDGAALQTLQYQLGMGAHWGKWSVPKEFMPDGQLQRDCERNLSLTAALPEGADWNTPAARRTWLELLRFGVGRSIFRGLRKYPSPSTVIHDLFKLGIVTRTLFALQDDSGRFWSLLEEAEFDALLNKTGPILRRNLSYLHARGVLPDAPRPHLRVHGSIPERIRQGESAPIERVKNDKQWQPFPDQFTSEAGWRSVHLIKFVGPALLDALDAAMAVSTRQRLRGGEFTHAADRMRRVAEARDPVIANWKWVDTNGEPLLRLPFELQMAGTRDCFLEKGETTAPICWPPKTFADAWKWLWVLQGAHLFSVCLASGPRASEVSSLRDDCLVDAPVVGTRLNGKTFKLTGIVGGRKRDFPAPDIVAQAIAQQMRLASLVKHRGEKQGDHLWVQISNAGKGTMGAKLLTFSSFMNSFVTRLGLRQLLTEDNPRMHVHRFRKSLARIVALSLVNSPMILMDCFGHEDSEMTIRRYILSDRSIAREVLAIQRELVIMLAVDAAINADSLGGPAGENLRERKAAFLQRLGKSEFEPQDAYEFARRETFDGRTWMMVSPGIYCTLPHGASGPCGNRQGGINPSYCRSGCENQLLTEYSKAIVDDAIGEIVTNLQRAESDDEPMLVAQWAGQLRNWLYRWEELTAKWEAHPLVKKHGKLRSTNEAKF